MFFFGTSESHLTAGPIFFLPRFQGPCGSGDLHLGWKAFLKTAVCAQVITGFYWLRDLFFGFSILLCFWRRFCRFQKWIRDSLGRVDYLMLAGSLVHFPGFPILTQISIQLEVFKKWLRLGLPKSFELRWICCHSRLHSLLTVQVVTKCLEVYSENVTRKTCYFLWPEAFPAWDVGILFGSSWTPSLALPNRRWQQGFANIRFDAIHRGVGWVRWTTSPLGCQ